MIENDEPGVQRDEDVDDDVVAAAPDVVEDVGGEADESDVHDGAAGTSSPTSLRTPALAGTLVVLILVGLCTFLGVQADRSNQAREQRNVLVGTAKQGAINLTTIDWQSADADVQRILGSATGPFYDDFSQRSKPFVDVVKQMKSTSVGTVTEAGVESDSGDEAQVLVSVSVKTTTPGSADERTRNWRMRVSVRQDGDAAKVSNVEFVP
jgi:Mce-associated membrane protein